MTALSGTNVAAPVVPFTDADTYPTHDAQYGKGGWRSVATYADMLEIPSERCAKGMQVRVTDDADSSKNGLWDWNGSEFTPSDFSQIQANSVYNSSSITASAATLALDVSTVSLFEITLTQPTTAISVTGGPSSAGLSKQITLKLKQGTGVNQIDWDSIDVVWVGDAEPRLSFEQGFCDLVTLVKFGAGSWIGSYGGGWFED